MTTKNFIKKRILILGTVLGLIVTEQTFSDISIGFGVGTERTYHRDYREYPRRKTSVGVGVGVSIDTSRKEQYKSPRRRHRRYRRRVSTYPSHWNTGFYVQLGIPGYARDERWDLVACKLEDQLDILQRELKNAERIRHFRRARAMSSDIAYIESDLVWLENRGYYCKK